MVARMYKPETAAELQRLNNVPAPRSAAQIVADRLPGEVKMGIKGLTDRHAEFNRIGELRKGDKKESDRKPGADLGPEFRFTSDDPSTVESFVESYGHRPTRLEVYLPHRTSEENFEAWKEEWVAGGLVHRCNGEMMAVWRGSDGKYHTDPRPCSGGCKEVGRMKIILPALERLAYVSVLTTSKHDIMRLSEQLRAYEQLRGDLRGVPFVLCRRKVKVSTPGQNGQRVRREKWLLSIEPAQEWVHLQIEAMRQAAFPQLGGQAPVALLPAAEVVEAPVVDGEPEFEEGEYEDEGDNTENLPTPPTKAQPEQKPTNGNGVQRPYTPEVLRTGIQRKASTLDTKSLCSDAQRGLIVGKLHEVWAGMEEATLNRHTVLAYLTGDPSSKKLTAGMASVLIEWLVSEKDDTGDYPLKAYAIQEANLIIRQVRQDAGQVDMFGEPHAA